MHPLPLYPPPLRLVLAFFSKHIFVPVISTKKKVKILNYCSQSYNLIYYHKKSMLRFYKPMEKGEGALSTVNLLAFALFLTLHFSFSIFSSLRSITYLSLCTLHFLPHIYISSFTLNSFLQRYFFPNYIFLYPHYIPFPMLYSLPHIYILFFTSTPLLRLLFPSEPKSPCLILYFPPLRYILHLSSLYRFLFLTITFFHIIILAA